MNFSFKKEDKDNNCIYKINLKYKIKKKEKSDNLINIFGFDFVKENRDKCTMIIEGKEYKLEEKLNISDFDKEILVIILKINNNLKSINDFFHNCSSLIYISDSLSDIDTSNMKNFNYIFCGCSSLKSLPDISKWNMKSTEKINFIFSNCSSLLFLPDISK